MNLISKYLETSIQTQNRGKLVVLLYEAAIKNLKQSVIALEGNNLQLYAKSINRAVEIIYELNMSLDMDKGGQISQNLRGLYNFFIRHLTKAGITRDITMINNTIDCLKNLHHAWSSIAA